MSETLREALKRVMSKRKSLHCVYGFGTPQGAKIVDDARKARYFTSDEAFAKWADLVSLTGCTIYALHRC